MATVGVRELKNGLSRYLARVRKGEIIVVTDRGEPVARLVPAGMPAHLEKLISDGSISWSGERFEAPRRPARLRPGSPPVSDAIGEDRR